ncbi:MAG: hypothetical protein LBG58_11590 [Planctomycetaceae bacterium]|jgi:Mrp family chromosome partitioning ATPase|nr:hypothetical protein [Planctomycetaceae bacterium]
MSVTPEPISRKDERQSDSINSNNIPTPEESFLLPSVLRGAAYISSGGRVYRLFSDSDEISFPMASFEKTLQFDPLPEIPSIDDFVSPSPLEDIVSPLEDISESLIRLLSVSSAETVKNFSALPSILQLKQQPPTLSITESITQNHPQENHSQEHSVPKNLPSKEKTEFPTGSYKIFSETEQDEQINAPPRTPLYQLTRKNPVLKLFEAFPEWSVSPDVSSTEIPVMSNSLASKLPVLPKTESAITPIIRIIRLEIPYRPRKSKRCFYRLPLRRWEKIQNSPPTEQDIATKQDIISKQDIVSKQDNTSKSVVDIPVSSADEKIDWFIPQVHAELTIPSETKLSSSETKLSSSETKLHLLETKLSSLETKPSFPEPSPPESSLPESSTMELENRSDTLPFPLREPLPAGLGHADHVDNKNGAWRLLWQSHWPEHLKSLELAASDQICFLADHLEIQKEQKRKVFSFNSVQSGDGCTTLALCAARELAERGYRVLLADAHCQNPELPQLLHLKTNPDFCEIITLIPDRLELLPWSETSIEINTNTNTNDHTTQSFAEIVGSFRDDYDFILLDNGSLVECPLSEHVLLWREMSSDGVLLVLNMKNPAPLSVRAIAQRLLQNQINLLGIVENYV